MIDPRIGWSRQLLETWNVRIRNDKAQEEQRDQDFQCAIDPGWNLRVNDHKLLNQHHQNHLAKHQAKQDNKNNLEATKMAWT